MLYKLVIIGSGPAGLTAGIYAARLGLQPLLFSGEKPGGQLAETALVENWPGEEAGIRGPQLIIKMRRQAEKFGTKIIDRKVTKAEFTSKVKEVHTLEVKYQAEAVIIATGAESVFLHVAGEKELLGRGVATCAVCDAPLYKDKIAAVVGGGDAACEDALALTKFAKKVYLIVRREKLRASKIMAERVKSRKEIEILWQTEIAKINGQEKVSGITLKDGRELAADGVFLAIGHQPATAIFKDQLELNEKGCIKTSATTMTSIAGVFAAGDCVDSRYRQAVTAAGMGCQAALDAQHWLENKNNI